MHGFLDTRTFLKPRRVPFQTFSVLWERKLPTEKCDMPLLSIKFFDNGNVLKHRRAPLRKILVLLGKKFSTKSLDIPSLFPPPVSSLTFSDTEIFLKHRSVPLSNVSLQWDKNIDGESWYPPLYKNFYDSIFFETQNGSPRCFLVLWDHNFSIENRDIPLLGIKFFDTRNFLKHRKVHLRNDSVLWDQKNDRKLCYPSPFYAWTFWILKLFWNTEGFPFSVFRYCETENFRQKNVISPSYL